MLTKIATAAAALIIAASAASAQTVTGTLVAKTAGPNCGHFTILGDPVLGDVNVVTVFIEGIPSGVFQRALELNGQAVVATLGSGAAVCNGGAVTISTLATIGPK